MWPWASDSTSRCLSFPSCKTRLGNIYLLGHLRAIKVLLNKYNFKINARSIYFGFQWPTPSYFRCWVDTESFFPSLPPVHGHCLSSATWPVFCDHHQVASANWFLHLQLLPPLPYSSSHSPKVSLKPDSERFCFKLFSGSPPGWSMCETYLYEIFL